MKNGYNQMRSESKDKDSIVHKLRQIIDEQEKYLMYFKIKTKNDIDGRLKLFDFQDYSFTIEENQKSRLKFQK